MSETEKILEILSDHANALEALAVNLKHQLGELGTGKPELDLKAIAWVQAEGEHGSYEKSEDVNNLEFKKLVKALSEHKGKMVVDNFFIWLFANSSTIGKKPQKRK